MARFLRATLPQPHYRRGIDFANYTSVTVPASETASAAEAVDGLGVQPLAPDAPRLYSVVTSGGTGRSRRFSVHRVASGLTMVPLEAVAGADALSAIGLTGADDTAGGADAVSGSGPVPNETASGAETVLLIAISAAETAVGSDGPVEGVNAADTASGADASANLGPLPAETASAAESTSAALSAAETASVAEGIGLRTLSAAETASGAETASISPLVAETGAGAEGLGGIFLSAADTASLADSALSNQGIETETASAADALSLIGLYLGHGFVWGSSTWGGGLAYGFDNANGETGAAAETRFVTVNAAETGTGAESIVGLALSLAATGSAAEAVVLPVLSIGDTSSAVEALSLVAISTAETVGATEGVFAFDGGTLVFAGPESGLAAEAAQITVNPAETASGADVALGGPAAADVASVVEGASVIVTAAETVSAIDVPMAGLSVAATASAADALTFGPYVAETASVVDSRVIGASGADFATVADNAKLAGTVLRDYEEEHEPSPTLVTRGAATAVLTRVRGR